MSYLAQLLPPEELGRLDYRAIRVLEAHIDKELNTSPEVRKILQKSVDTFAKQSGILKRKTPG